MKNIYLESEKDPMLQLFQHLAHHKMIWFKNRYKLGFGRLLVNYKEFYI